jgi:predicted protein tyrosine phosphatase
VLKRLLFVCSRNQWRSPTAERVWRGYPGLEVRSAGTSEQARRRVTLADVEWADVVLVMEKKHRARLREEFGAELDGKELHVLDIPDEYQFMDPELVGELKRTVGSLLGLQEFSEPE